MTGSSDGGFTFIVGLRKSGSTWLLNLMSLHPDIRGLMETNLFHIAWAEPDPVRRTERLFTQSPWSEGGARVLRRSKSVSSVSTRLLSGLTRANQLML